MEKAREKALTNAKKCKASHITKILDKIMEIINFVLIIRLFILSSDNPFDKHIIGDLSNYFSDINTSNISMINNNTSIHNNFTSIIPENKISKKSFLRRLVSGSFCLEIRNDFETFKGKKLSNIFDLDYDKIRTFSKIIIILDCFQSFFYIIYACCFCNKYFDRFKYQKIFVIVTIIIVMALYLAKFILGIVLFYFFQKGDVEKYDDFLECKNVKIKFFEKFSDINTIRGCFIAFIILNVAIQGTEKLKNILSND